LRVIISFYIALIVSSTALFAQVADSAKTDSVKISSPNAEAKNDSVLASQKKEVKVKTVNLWKNRIPSFSEKITTDSLLRWNIYPNWGDFYAYQSNVISYRQGTIGRTDAFNINGYDQYEQNLWLDDILLNDPVTGLINYNYVPHHKIGTVYQTYNGDLNSYVNIRDYYINEPVSYLNFDEASNDYRNLEFFVAQNTAPGTNIELSYWDRRDGGFYPNNSVQGSQIMGRIYHHLGEKYQIQGLILRNDFNNDESGGYVVNDPSTFGFGEFTSNPVNSSGNSETLRNDIKLGLYQRTDTASAESGGLIMNRTKNDRVVRISADTLSRELLTHSAQIFKKVELGLLSIQGNATVNLSDLKSGNSITRNNWFTSEAKITTELELFDGLKLIGSGNVISRNTGHSGSEFSSGINIGSSENLNLKLTASVESRIPTIQTLYWSSKDYSGNSNLENEKITSLYGEVSSSLGSYWKAGASGRLKFTENRIVLDEDSTFSNTNSQDLAFISGFVRFQNPNFEIESSAAYETALSFESDQSHSTFGSVDTKLWIRNALFYKNYAFNRAAFVKIGVRTLLSPFAYESQFYNTELDYWQSNSLTNDGSMQSFVPAFFRMDAELSARVRAIMVVIRWENALDGLGQAGYFEASSFPMLPRRLIVGIRAQFRN
jgi:hypothetical protein